MHHLTRQMFALASISFLAAGASSAATIWTGASVAFAKAAFADPADPANQDPIVGGVSLTRGDTRGLYNAAAEASYSQFTSPADTEWAFPNNNPGLAISAQDFAQLTFDTWVDAHGFSPPSAVGQPSVLHIISQDIYLDVTLDSWAVGRAGGGGFSYTRSTLPEPSAGALVLVGLAAPFARNRGNRT